MSVVGQALSPANPSSNPGTSNLNRMLSNPPPEAPCRDSRCAGALCPVAAWCQFARIKSLDHRGSPMHSALGFRRIVSACCGHCAMHDSALSAHSGPMHK
jgi:hypothetical protein